MQWYADICLNAVFNAWSQCCPNDQLQHLWLYHNAPYLPDLAPADFFLFGFVNEKLHSQEFSSAQAAVHTYKDEVENIPQNMWHSTFDDWFACMTACVNVHGDYVN